MLSVLVLLLSLTACASGLVATPRAPTPTLWPVATVTHESIVTGTTQDGQPIVITTVRIVQEVKDTQGNLQGYRTGNKIQVSRTDSVSWLKSSNTPNKFGCDIEVGSSDTFGCYFGSTRLVDLDKDGEPEIVTAWEQGGSSGFKSLHESRRRKPRRLRRGGRRQVSPPLRGVET